MHEPTTEPRTGRSYDPSLDIPWEAMLCYLPVFCLYPWSLRREMPQIAGHARQGMILFAVELFLFLITVPTFYKLIWLVILVLAVLGVWSAFNGRPYRLPLLGDLAERVGAVAGKPPEPKDEVNSTEE